MPVKQAFGERTRWRHRLRAKIQLRPLSAFGPFLLVEGKEMPRSSIAETANRICSSRVDLVRLTCHWSFIQPRPEPDGH